MRLVWSATVVDEIESLAAYLAETSSSAAAARIVKRLVERGEQIVQFPESGREVEDFRSPLIREVLEGPYRIVYEINRSEDRIEVVAVFHGKRLPPWRRDA